MEVLRESGRLLRIERRGGACGSPSMHCGRVPGGLESCSAFVKGAARDGRAAHGTAMAMAVSRTRDVSLSRRAMRRVVCAGSASSRRVSYKRRQQPPSKGFPTSHEADVFEKTQQDLQKTRALEFLCENDEASTSDGAFNIPNSLVDDGSWSSRILMQVCNASYRPPNS